VAADILIHRCTLRIARRGGWSWGADPRGLLKAAMQRLPELIAARLGELWPAQDERQIAAPLRLRVSLRLDELLALTGDAAGEAHASAMLAGNLAQRIDKMVQDLVLREAGTAAVDQPAITPANEAATTELPDVQTLWAGSVLSVLLGWQRQGTLQTQLLSFSPASLASWHDSLLRLPRGPGPPPDASVRASAVDVAAELAAMQLPLPAGRVASLIRRISLVVSAAQRFGLSPGDALLAEALQAHRAFDLPMDEAPSISSVDDARGQVQPADTPQHEQPAASQQRPAARTAPVPARRQPRAQFDIKVASALPFLLLGPLSRTGYLQTLSAVFEAAQLLPELPCFAVALARKVLAPPQRGWFRNADAVMAAAAFAGQVESPPDAQIAELARHISPQVSPLDAVVANVLTEGHTRGRPLILQTAPLNGEAGWLLCEEEGLFPIAWAERIERLYPQLAALGGELLLVPEVAISTDLLDHLDDAGFRFVTDASPARGRSWRALHKGSLRAWSNDRHGSAGSLQSAAERLESGASSSQALWLALTAERPGLPVGSEAGVERSLALAAALALGTIGWTLWREREAVTPLLALHRFADLDARVSFRPDRVQVHLPLGRRFMDLKQGGLLEDIADVPWFDGRPLLFAQG
jgi:hypothetical protein